MKQELKDLINNCTTELNDIETRISKLPSLDKGILYLTNYALIKASGTVEIVYRSIVADYFLKYNDARIDNFIDASVRRGSMSAKYENMCNLLGKFDKAWADKFKTTVAANSDGKKMIETFFRPSIFDHFESKQ